MKIRMIVTDLDDTLLNHQKMISDYTADILNRCHQKGIELAFATARPERTLRPFQRQIKCDYVISNNGATLSHNGKIVYSRNIPGQMTNELLSDLISAEDVTCITVEAGDCLYTTYEGIAWEEEWKPVYNDFKTKLKFDAPKISAECSNGETLQAILKKYPRLRLVSNYGEDWYQIVSQNASKVNGIAAILKETHLSFSSVAAFGNDFNDIEMLQKCGIGVAVSNGIDRAKRAANFICDSNENDGVAKWIVSHVIGQ